MTQLIQPELILREYFQTSKPIKRKENNLIFSDNIVLKLDTTTAFYQKSNNRYYSVGTLWFWLNNRNETISLYWNECRKEKIEPVSNMDKEKLRLFFVEGQDDVDIYHKDKIESTRVLLGNKRPQEGKELNILSNDKSNNNRINFDKSDLIKNPDVHSNIHNNKELLSNNTLLLNEDPNKKLMEYLLIKEKNNINRNSMIRIPSIRFDYLLPLTRKTFCKNQLADKLSNTVNPTVKNIKNTFLDEITNDEDFENKAIIIVPPSYIPGNLCRKNAKKFLCNSQYTGCDNENINNNNNNNDDDSYSFKKKIQGKEITFEIHDNVNKFTKSDWKRVVAVFVTGNNFEFKDWPKGESTVSIFLKVKGFYMKYSDFSFPSNVLKWNVKKLEIHRTKRHLDVSIQNDFWNTLEEFLLLPRYREVNYQGKNNQKGINSNINMLK